MSVKAVIFDKDGTVLDFAAFWLPVAVKATEIILSGLGIIDIPSEKVLEAMGVSDGVASINGSLCYGTYRDMAEDTNAVLRRYGYKCDIDELTQLVTETYHNVSDEGEIRPACDGLAEVMEELRERGIKIILVTSDGPAVTRKCLDGLGISKYFDKVLTDDGTHPNKPDPFMIDMLCREYGLDKSEIVMVGDTLTDLTFANNGGIRGIGLAADIENKAILFQKTDTVIPDVSHLNEVI